MAHKNIFVDMVFWKRWCWPEFVQIGQNYLAEGPVCGDTEKKEMARLGIWISLSVIAFRYMALSVIFHG